MNPAPPVTVVLGNREPPFNELAEITLRKAYKDVNFEFVAASRVDEFIEFAARPETKLAMFIPPGNLIPDPDVSCATPEQEAVRIVKAVKAKSAVPIIVVAARREVREAVLAAGASMALEIAPQAQQLVDAVAQCLGLAPVQIVSP